jgi:type I restriction enzyme S subunit
MSSTSERPTNEQTRTYGRASSVVFLKTDAPFGGLSNMAGGFPLHVQGTRIYTSEALYQACRFPHLPEVQRLIIGQASPMTAKMKSKPYRKDSRPDWDRVRVKVMRWCLRVKLAQNWAKFSELLLRTGDRPIVEESRRDDFWGAKPVDEQTLVGMNVLGRLLMELREAVKAHGPAGFQAVGPLDIPEFLFLGRPIGTMGAHELGARDVASTSTARAPDHGVIKETAEQGSLFVTPAAREGSAPACITSPTPESTRLSELKPYPAMKNSGVPWLGQVPEHWQVSPVFAVYRPRQVRNTGLVESTVLSLSYGRIIVKAPEKLRGLVPESFETYQIVDPGNIIVRTTDLQNDQTSLRIGHARHRGIITAAYMCLETKPIVLNEFGYQYLNAYDLLKIIYGFGSGLRQNLDFSDIKRMPVLVPPRGEQAAIVRFLDHADRRIRRYIRAKQKLIKLLEEQKQAIIHRAVTRGLNPNVRLKPSGVEWLGDVPEHWEVLTLRRVITRAVDGPHHSPRYLGSGIPFLSARNIKADRWSLGNAKYISEADYAEFSKRVVPEMGDVLYTKGGTTGVARAVDLNFRFQVWVHVAVLKVKRHKVQPEYLALVLNSPRCYEQAQLLTRGATNQDLGLGRMKGIVLALPQLSEQEELLRAIEERTRGLNDAAEKARREIELLRECRVRLIADVVTGKLDVREAAARLPQEAEGLEPLDEAEVEGDAEESGDVDGVTEEAEA